MKTSTAGLMALITREAIVLTRYLDSVKVWTIGVGHTAAAGEPNPKTFKGEITVAQAFDLLRKDIAKYEAGVNKAVKVPLKQHEFDALVSFHYNTGAIGRATLVKSLNAGNKALAGQQFMSWVKPKEITKRRQSERDQFLLGKYPEPFATILPATPAGKILWNKGKSIDLRKALGATGKAAQPDPAAPVPKPRPEPGDVYASEAMVMLVQEKLYNLGYTEVGSRSEKTGKFDGMKGDMTNAAILAFRQENGLPVTADIDAGLLLALDTAPKRKLNPGRTDATDQQIREKVPEAKTAWWNGLIGKVVALPGMAITAVLGVAENFGIAREKLEPIKEFLGEVPAYVWIGGAAGIALAIWLNARRGQAASSAAFKSGARR